MSVNPIPEGYHSVTPYLIVDGADAAIRFYEKAFGATEVMRMPMGDRIAHAEIKIGNSHVMLADEHPDQGHLGPTSRGGATGEPDDLSARRRCGLRPRGRRRRDRRAGRRPTSSGATAWARSRIRSAINGRWRPIPRTCRPKRWSGAWRRRSSSPPERGPAI